MTEMDFLAELTRHLRDVPEADRKEIMADYVEHFRAGRDRGLSDDEIARGLGDPAELARAAREELPPRTGYAGADGTIGTGQVSRMTLAGLALILFNLIFVLGPWAGLVGGLIGLWAGAVAAVLSGIGVVLAVLFEPVIRTWVDHEPYPGFGIRLAAVAAGIMVSALGGLWCLGMAWISKWFARGTMAYLRANGRIIRSR